MNNYQIHAQNEFKAAGWLNNDGTFKNKMQEKICKHVLKLLDVFHEEGHSGSSALYAIRLFSMLAKFEPLVPLTGEDWEWNEVGSDMWQNKRCSHVFKDANRFDGQAYDINGIVFYDYHTDEDGNKAKSYFTSGDSAKPITFPYTPTTEYQERIEE